MGYGEHLEYERERERGICIGFVHEESGESIDAIIKKVGTRAVCFNTRVE